MQIQDLKLTRKRKRARRVGRGGKRGVYSGRGIKGQRARTNKRLKLKRIGSGLSRHLPKIGGFLGKRSKISAVSLSRLEEKFQTGEKIDPRTLKSKGIIKNARQPVKILGGGKITKKFIIEGCLISASAKQIIEKAGGSVK
jgi:large subunit ribosomal protein L15